jgi:hypothetical protein
MTWHIFHHADLRDFGALQLVAHRIELTEQIDQLLVRASKEGITFYGLSEAARELRNKGLTELPRCEVKQQSIEGRSGQVAVQG